MSEDQSWPPQTTVELVARAIHDAQCSCGTWREPSREWQRRGLKAAWDTDHYHSPRQIEGEWIAAAHAAIAALEEQYGR